MPKRKSKTTEYLKLDCSFIGVPDDTVCSPELNALSVHSRWLYVVILTKFNRLKTRIKDVTVGKGVIAWLRRFFVGNADGMTLDGGKFLLMIA